MATVPSSSAVNTPSSQMLIIPLFCLTPSSSAPPPSLHSITAVFVEQTLKAGGVNDIQIDQRHMLLQRGPRLKAGVMKRGALHYRERN